MKTLEEKSKTTIWKVLHFAPGEEYPREIYKGRGENARLVAKQRYNSVVRAKGKIGLYRGTYSVKIRRADVLPSSQGDKE